jgi:hypothetical protein
MINLMWNFNNEYKEYQNKPIEFFQIRHYDIKRLKKAMHCG